ncbi:MAG: hypothetical protein RL479_2551, partial [Verrucomicrobiota bacterium]
MISQGANNPSPFLVKTKPSPRTTQEWK